MLPVLDDSSDEGQASAGRQIGEDEPETGVNGGLKTDENANAFTRFRLAPRNPHVDGAAEASVTAARMTSLRAALRDAQTLSSHGACGVGVEGAALRPRRAMAGKRKLSLGMDPDSDDEPMLAQRRRPRRNAAPARELRRSGRDHVAVNYNADTDVTGASDGDQGGEMTATECDEDSDDEEHLRRRKGQYRQGADEREGTSDLEIVEDGVTTALSGRELERIMASKTDNGRLTYLCKYKGVSYRHLEWLSHATIAALRPQLLCAYQRKVSNGRAPPDDSGTADGVRPEWRLAERVFAVRECRGVTQYLTKWTALGYAESTWEDADELASEEDRELLRRFDLHKDMPAPARATPIPELVGMLDRDEGMPDFKHDRKLRDYQVESFKWMVAHNLKGGSCILGDEMGLGKTAQSISVLEFRRVKANVRGPFLVVAPLTTLGHWRREIETWTDMNVICFMGSAADRQLLVDHELWHREPSANGRLGRKTRTPKFHVMLTSFEMVRDCVNVFTQFRWDITIVDEAHRLKALQSATRQSIMQLHTEQMILLTGTPIQNNMRELFSIMNLVRPQSYPCCDAFLARFGNPPAVPSTPEQLQALQDELRPILLRRMKEDVETLPDKEEVIIWTELTNYQRSYYKALFENQIGSLLAGASNKQLPNLRNLAMELRKVCCHPFLCNGLEDDLTMRLGVALNRPPSQLEAFESASGKITLLAKLLPKLQREGHKVLIFSQFVIMLDLIEYYLNLLHLPMERIDGNTSGQNRQAAMDRFQAGGDSTFAFLLSTKAGGQGITLTAADTIIIYDSDWNPQNDIQAMARAHRIGQTNEVTIYRLISTGTYEETLINTANQKAGLNEAILGSVNAEGSPEDNAKRIARLLREGANSIVDEGRAAEKAAHFEGQGIDDILAQRTSKRNIANKAGSTFSVATFRANEAGSSTAPAGDDASFWKDLLPEAVKAHQVAEASKNLVSGPRRRREVNYREPTRVSPKKPGAGAGGAVRGDVHMAGSDCSSGLESDSDVEELKRKSSGGTSNAAGEGRASGDARSGDVAGVQRASSDVAATDQEGVAALGSARLQRAVHNDALTMLTALDSMLMRWGPRHIHETLDNLMALEGEDVKAATCATEALNAVAADGISCAAATAATPGATPDAGEAVAQAAGEAGSDGATATRVAPLPSDARVAADQLRALAATDSGTCDLTRVKAMLDEWQVVLVRASQHQAGLPKSDRMPAALKAHADAAGVATELLATRRAADDPAAASAARETIRAFQKAKDDFYTAKEHAVDRFFEIVLKDTRQEVRELWESGGKPMIRLTSLLMHPLVKHLRMASAKLVQCRQRNRFYRAYKRHGRSGVALLAKVTAVGDPLPPPDAKGDALAWLRLHGLWREGVAGDGALVDAAMAHGCDCRTASRADGLPLLAAALRAQVGDPCAKTQREGGSSVVSKDEGGKGKAWHVLQRPDGGGLVVSEGLHNALAVACAKRFVALTRVVELHTAKSSDSSAAGPCPGPHTAVKAKAKHGAPQRAAARAPEQSHVPPGLAKVFGSSGGNVSAVVEPDSKERSLDETFRSGSCKAASVQDGPRSKENAAPCVKQ